MAEQPDAESLGRVPAVGEPAPDVTLRDEEGNEVTLSTFWRERPTFFVWIRHFG